MGGDILSESFEGAGYENTWSETKGASSTVDEDNTDIVPPIKKSRDILKIDKISPNFSAYTYHDSGSEHSTTYTTFFVRISAEVLNNRDRIFLMVVWNNSGEYPWKLKLQKGLSGEFKFLFDIYNNGLNNEYFSDTKSLNIWYRIDIKYDTDEAVWEWKVNEILQDSGLLIGTYFNGPKCLAIGDKHVGKAITAYFDLINIDSHDYVSFGIITFAALAADPTSQKDFLCIITPKKRHENWTKTGGQANVYEITWANIFQASSNFGNSYRVISSVEHNETALAVQANVAAVDADDGSYYHDTANSKLYIHTTDSSNPNNVGNYIVVFFNLYFSSGLGKDGRGKIFNDIYYEPLFSGLNMPSITYEQTGLLAGGGLATGAAVLEFLNTHAFWDIIWRDYSWKNADIKLYYGGEDLPFTQYQFIWFAYIKDEHWSDSRIWFDTVNYVDLLKRNIPINPLFGANVETEDRGKPIPLCFGIVTGITPLCSDNSTADAREYTIADATYQTLKAIDVVYDDGVAVGAGDLNLDLANCKFTFVTYTPTGKVTCDVKGAKISDITGESSTDLMTNASDIIRFLLMELLEVPSSKLNTSSFSTAKIANDFELLRYIRYRRNASSYIAEIENSVMGNLYVNNDGEWQLDVFEPNMAEDDTLEDEEMADFKEHKPFDKIFAGLKVHYNPLPYERDETSPISESEDNVYQVTIGTNDRARYEDKQKAAYKYIYTWIRTLSDADILKGRLLLFTNTQAIELDINAKGIKLFKRKPGDVLKITRARAATSTGAMSEEIYQILRIDKGFAQNQTVLRLDNTGGIGIYIGIWTVAAAPNWAAATVTEKQQQGFWGDASGYCDPTDFESYKKSVWW